MTKEEGERGGKRKGEREKGAWTNSQQMEALRTTFAVFSLGLKLSQNKKPKTYVRNDNGDIVPL